MAVKTFRYRGSQGVTEDFLDARVPGGVSSVGTLVPPSFQDVTCDDSVKTDLDTAMAEAGFAFIEENPPAMTTVGIAQIQSIALAVNSAAVPLISGWTDVVEGSGGSPKALARVVSTRGGTQAGIVFSATNSAILVGGQCRIVVNGGALSNVVLSPILTFPLVVGSLVAFTYPFAFPSNGSRVDYTVKVQAQGIGVASSITLAAGASLTVFEYA